MTDAPVPATTPSSATLACPVCGAPHAADSSFCEACGADLAPGTTAVGASPAAYDPVLSPATPQTAPAGEESPLDVGWTGAVRSTDSITPAGAETCTACGQGQIVDGYCDHCGTPPPDPRNHFAESPSTWVGGVCDIGRRHSRNEDAMSLSAVDAPGGRAVIVVCDGVSMATDSHIASLAAARTARAALDQPLPRGVGTPDAWSLGATRALASAVHHANEAVRRAVDGEVANPPSCTLAAAVVEDGVIVSGTVGDSRVYWLPDSSDEPARQLGQDDSYAQERMAAGVPRQEAENGPHAHSITRWLGSDAPEDLTPHVETVATAQSAGGWLLVCSDGLWNYCSPAEDLRMLVHGTLERVGSDPTDLAQALVDYANDRGGRDNITVALARLAGRGSHETTGAATAAPEEGEPTHG